MKKKCTHDYQKRFDKRKATTERHVKMKIQVFDCKIVYGKLSRAQRDEVNRLFREAKWYENYVLDDSRNASTIVKTVPVHVGEEIEERPLTILSGQMKQELKKRLIANFKALKKKKERGEEVGKVDFKSVCNSIPLIQFGVTYRIDFERNRISIQKLKKSFYVRGLKQIPRNAEIANAVFVRKPDGLHFLVTCFVEPESQSKADGKIGVDLGIKHSVVTSEGETFDIRVPENKKIKLASRRFNRSAYKAKKLGVKNIKHGKNHNKRRRKLKKAYQHVVNQRKDLANKAVHKLLAENSFIAMQDELITLWRKGWFGRQVQWSALGEIKAQLKRSSKTRVIESGFPSTQLCPRCGGKTKHSLEKREFICSHCGYTAERDINAANNILAEALLRECN